MLKRVEKVVEGPWVCRSYVSCGVGLERAERDEHDDGGRGEAED